MTPVVTPPPSVGTQCVADPGWSCVTTRRRRSVGPGGPPRIAPASRLSGGDPGVVVVDLARGDSVQVGLHDHPEQGLVDPAAPFEQAGKIKPARSLNRPGSGGAAEPARRLARCLPQGRTTRRRWAGRCGCIRTAPARDPSGTRSTITAGSAGPARTRQAARDGAGTNQRQHRAGAAPIQLVGGEARRGNFRQAPARRRTRAPSSRCGPGIPARPDRSSSLTAEHSAMADRVTGSGRKLNPGQQAFTYPEKLKAGDRVAVLSPSLGLPAVYPAPFELGLQRLREEFQLEPVEFPTTRCRRS
jgi:hypothetical protein